MATNFHIFLRQKDDFLELKLRGDFDDNSAEELIRTLSENSEDVSRVFIRTRELKRIEEAGRRAFQRGVSHLKALRYRLIFADENGLRICPDFREF